MTLRSRLAKASGCWLPTMLLALVSVAASVAARGQAIAITFDDLPAHSSLPKDTTRLEIAQKVIRALRDAGVPPTYGFVNGKRFQDEPAGVQGVLEAWRAAGNPLGNHTWSHMDLGKNTLEAWGADVLRNEPVLERYSKPGDDWRWLRFPFLAEGDTAEKRAGARLFLKQHGYRIAAVTMSFGDYAWNEPYARCVAKGDASAVSALEKSYLEAAKEDIVYRRALAKASLGHEIPFVLLMHIGAMDARLLPQLLGIYKGAGFRFVSLQEAERDPFYASDLDLSLSGESDSLEAVAKAKGVKDWPKHEGLPAELNTVCR